jgi:hypothetical protein
MENKVIFESEYSFINIMNDCGLPKYMSQPQLFELLKTVKEKGYIRKSAVEEAEEVYKEWFNRPITYIDDVILANNNIVLFCDIIRILHDAIQEQNKEIEILTINSKPAKEAKE